MVLGYKIQFNQSIENYTKYEVIQCIFQKIVLKIFTYM